MREIKFRVLNPNNKKMVSHEDFFRDIDPFKRDNLILMQATGVKDINGVEIYEEDIVRYDLGEHEAELEGEENRYVYGWVTFESGAFMVTQEDVYRDYLCEDGQECKWEVVGDIFTTPELFRIKDE